MYMMVKIWCRKKFETTGSEMMTIFHTTSITARMGTLFFREVKHVLLVVVDILWCV